MPKENKKRGRWAESRKRKLQEEEEIGGADDELETSAFKRRRRRSHEGNDRHEDTTAHDTLQLSEHDREHDYETLQQGPDPNNQVSGRPFYGLLDDSEQEYFRRADDMLEANQFADSEERSLFLDNVYKEAAGKELKIACSQSCSRLLERLILLSNAQQLKTLFKQLSGNFLHLVQHRFASHCCEALFLHAGPLVSQELLAPSVEDTPASSEETIPAEELVLSVVNELTGNMGYLMTDKFASHALRILLIVLSGQSLDPDSPNSLLKSRKKEHVDVAGVGQVSSSDSGPRPVPESFKSAMEQIMTESITGLDSHYLRTLATHRVGNPMLQLLLQLEATHFGKQRAREANSIIKTLLPDDAMSEGTESATFINGIIYDAIGSHLVESIVKHAPGKMFKSLYKDLLKARIGSLARNETASYVVARVLERLGHDDLGDAVQSILPQIPNLAGRGRLAIIRVLLERCDVRNVDTTPLWKALRDVYSEDGGATFSLSKLLNLPVDTPMPAKAVLKPSNGNNTMQSDSEEPLSHKPGARRQSENSRGQNQDASTIHASLLAQAMLRSPGPLSTAAFESISAFSPDLCLHMALIPPLSQVLQTSLTVSQAPLIFRRKLITRFYSHIGALAIDPSGSHMVDAIWRGTQGLAFVRERIAEELAENERLLRESPSGRKVWRNWRMDLYCRRRGEWVRLTRETAGNDGFLSFPGGESDARRSNADSAGTLASTHGVGARSTSSGIRQWKEKDRTVAQRSAHRPISAAGSASGKGKSKLELARERFARSSTLTSS